MSFFHANTFWGFSMNLRKYEAFASVISLGSLTRAAEALGCTQSAVSHMINSLENELGFRLLIRSRHGVKLTADGEKALPAVLAVLDANERLEQIVSSIHGLDAGVVRIGAFTSVAVHWLPGMIKGFQKMHPNIEFRLNNGDYHDVEQWLLRDECDLGFVTLPNELSCECVELIDDPLLAIIPNTHPLAQAEVFPIRRIEQEDFISLLETSSHDARRVFKSAGVTPNVKFKTKDDYAIIAMVENGLGISIMPQLLLKNRSENVKVLPLDQPFKRTIALATSETGAGSPAVKAFAQYVQQWVKEQQK